MSVEYQEWPPGAALKGVVLAYWRVVGDGLSVPSPMILPDAHVEVVVNLGGPVTLVGSQFTGTQPVRAVVGLLETAIEIHYPADVCTFGIRLHPARAATFLSVPARALVNSLNPLRRVSAASTPVCRWCSRRIRCWIPPGALCARDIPCRAPPSRSAAGHTG